MRLLNRISFGTGGDGVELLVAGWSHPEAEFTWSINETAFLDIPIVGAVGDIQIELSIQVHSASIGSAHRRVAIAVDGVPLLAENLAADTFVALRLDRSQIEGREKVRLAVSIENMRHRQASIEGAEQRSLGIALREAVVLDVSKPAPFKLTARKPVASSPEVIRGVTGLTPTALAMAFESLGTNCEFGLVQRRCGAEPMGLMRFAGLPYRHLVEGIELGFTALADPHLLSCAVEGLVPEWMVENHRYGMRYHSGKSPNAISADSLIREQSTILNFRREKFFEVVTTGEKLFVVKRPQGLSVAQALPLLTVLRSRGPNSLLFVSDDTGLPPGTVHAIAPDLYLGSLDGVPLGADENEIIGRDTWLSDAALSAWLSVCANAYRLWRELGHPSLGPCD